MAITWGKITMSEQPLSGLGLRRQGARLKTAVESAIHATKRRQDVFDLFIDALHQSGFDVVEIPRDPPHTSSEIGHG